MDINSLEDKVLKAKREVEILETTIEKSNRISVGYNNDNMKFDPKNDKRVIYATPVGRDSKNMDQLVGVVKGTRFHGVSSEVVEYNLRYGVCKHFGDDDICLETKSIENLAKKLDEKKRELEKLETTLKLKKEKLGELNGKNDDRKKGFENLSVAELERKAKSETGELSREDLENRLKEIEDNHSFIQANTGLVETSNSFLGKLRKLFGSKKVLDAATLQKKADELELALNKEKNFKGEYTYEEALNLFKYDNIEGPEEIEVFESYGPKGDSGTKSVDKVSLDKFDYCCSEIGKKLHGRQSVDKYELEKILKESNKEEKVKEDGFSKELKGLVENEVKVAEVPVSEDKSREIIVENENKEIN